MKHITTLLLLILLGTQGIVAQTKISGKITDQKKQGIPGVNILVKDTYDGGTTDVNGNYSFTASDTGMVTLVATMVGFDPIEKKIRLTGKDIAYSPVMKESVNELNVVTISAGTIEASDEKRTTVLKPLDIVTTASAQGDIVGALKTLPGAQQVGESEGLFVRGGTGTETKTIIDGMVVNNPFFSSVPDIATRGRFSPFLFKGTVFSTGGYSAQYGQGMSSVLALETQDLPDRTSSTVAISTVGVGVGHNHLWKDKGMSAGFDLNYTNLVPYFSLVKQVPEYTRAPQFSGGSLNFRKKTSASGILKFYGYFNTSDLGIKTFDIDSTDGFKKLFELNNLNIYTNLTYKERLGEKYVLNIGASYSTNIDKIKTISDTIRSQSDLTQGRVVLSRGVGKLSIIRVGAEYQYAFDGFKIDSRVNPYYVYHNTTNIYDNYVAGFAESDIYLTHKLVLRLGVRAENSTLLKKAVIAPRTSIAYKLGQYSQVSFAYGEFYQKPDRDYLFYPQIPGYNKATHYILNVQRVDDYHTLRAEIYFKKYDNLTSTLSDTTNSGKGYAQGLDVFWRDKKSIKGVDYWISYTYLDTKRQWLNYPKEVMPPFAATHTATLVFKKFFTKLNLSTGLTYSYATGRPYYNPNNPNFMGDRTIEFNTIGVNAAYLRQIGNCFAVLAVSVGNVIGNQQVYSYNYSYDGMRREAVGPPAKRFFFIGLFLSFGQDRSKEVIDNNN
ncbi:MAG: TonB-dependent receptor [Bacteroidetes bacterium]|nr:TonB-dependent receptor [Bacteroidota bacterium]